jgi:hypothetical protein
MRKLSSLPAGTSRGNSKVIPSGQRFFGFFCWRKIRIAQDSRFRWNDKIIMRDPSQVQDDRGSMADVFKKLKTKN